MTASVTNLHICQQSSIGHCFGFWILIPLLKKVFKFSDYSLGILAASLTAFGELPLLSVILKKLIYCQDIFCQSSPVLKNGSDQEAMFSIGFHSAATSSYSYK